MFSTGSVLLGTRDGATITIPDSMDQEESEIEFMVGFAIGSIRFHWALVITPAENNPHTTTPNPQTNAGLKSKSNPNRCSQVTLLADSANSNC